MDADPKCPFQDGRSSAFHAASCSALPPVLDPCCGPRMWWFDKENPQAVFGDRRRETITVKDTSHGKADGERVLRIDPDVMMDFRNMPFADDTFDLVAFDPPHLVRAGAKSWMAAKYGKLGSDWREDLRAGFAECFRVLRPHGTLIFKWNETHVKLREILALSPVPPLFGNTSGRKSGTHWIAFLKPNRLHEAACGADSKHAGIPELRHALRCQLGRRYDLAGARRRAKTIPPSA